MIKTRVKFPNGFMVYDRKAREYSKAVALKPVCTITTSGFLSFNTRASKFLIATDGKLNQGVYVAYNSQKQALAVKPVAVHLKPPETYKLIIAGAYKNTVLIGFTSQARGWRIPLNGSRHPCMWDEKHGVLIVALSLTV